MTVSSHGDRKYQTAERLGALAPGASLQIELRRFAPGMQGDLTLECTEVAILLAGQAKVRRTGDGEHQEAIARPGSAWICPAGTHESGIEVIGRMDECLHVFLPPGLIERSALENHDLDPAKVRLAYAGGIADPMLLQIGMAFRGMLDRGLQPTDRLFVDGMQTALAAHLLGTYSLDRWQPVARAPALDPRRLQRVLDFVEARLAADISLDDLAAEACLSPFHFARLFREAMGMAPHRYLTERRIEAARQKLRLAHSSLVEIALDTGFGSQANFNRVFRKVTGLTPGQYRTLEAK